MLSAQPPGSRGTVAKRGVKMTAATGDEESAHVELPPKPTPQSDGSPYAETKEVAEVWYGGHHTLVVGYADANNAAVSGAKKAVADDTNSVRRPHMGGAYAVRVYA